MGEKSLTVLLTNDDGYRAKGIIVLADYLEEIADVRIVAPKRNQSGVGHSMSGAQKIKWRRKTHSKRKIYSVDGTPADCVFEGLNRFYQGEIDIVVSGINKGCNLGTDRFPSGTIAAAREAAFSNYGRVGIAISADYSKDRSCNFDLAADFCSVFTAWVAQALSNKEKRELFKGFYFNLNVPDRTIEELQGLALTDAYTDPGTDNWCEIVVDRGSHGVDRRRWHRGNSDDRASDYWAIQNGYLSLSILSVEKRPEQERDLESLLLEEFSFTSYRLERR